MGSSIRLGKILGVPLGVHYSWFLVFLLVTFILSRQLAQDYSSWSSYEHWLVAIATSLLFFISVVVHELSHSLVAIWRGIPVKGITLFVFGGVSQISHEARRPSTELLVAGVGPFSSLLLGALFGGLTFILKPLNEHLFAMASILVWVNIALGVFNMMPGFPLDGGRILRAVVWGTTGNYWRATLIASLAGRGLAFAIIGGGILTVVMGGPFGGVQGLWLVLIGWFLERAASASYHQFRIRQRLRDVTVREIMSTDYQLVPPNISLMEFMNRYGTVPGRRSFLVGTDNRVDGVATLSAAKKVPVSQRGQMMVRFIMKPVDTAHVSPEDKANTALELMDSEELHQLPVYKDGLLVGIVERSGVLKVAMKRKARVT